MDYQDLLKTAQAQEFRQNKGISEDNWKSRQTFCSTLSDAIEKRGKDGVPRGYVDQLEPFLNNMVDCAVSERTTLSIQGCRAIGNIPKILGRDVHPYLDRILPPMIKLCASSKSVAQKASANAVSNIIGNVTYSPRLLWHLCQCFEEKFTGPKIFGTGWLQQIMKDYSKSLTEREFDAIGRAISLGLEDADATVRTNSRGTFWTFHEIDPVGAQNIMEKINAHAKTALQNDPNNPDKKRGDKKAKGPSRSESALAQIREQAKKQKKQEMAAQQAQKLPIDDAPIEIHEPRASKPERKEKPLPPPPATDQDKHHMSKSAARPTVSKKAPPPEADSLKSSASSRGLLSAPVRRPRIVATPINGPQIPSQNSRPSSRTGQIRSEKDFQSDSRPTSSSSSKIPTSLSPISSPKLKPTSPPRARAFHMADGKENVSVFPHKVKPSPPNARAIQHSPPKRPQSATPKFPPGTDSSSHVHSLDSEVTPKPSLDQAPAPRLVPSTSEPPFVPTHAHGHMKSNSADYDLSSARRYVDLAMKHLHQGTLDPLGYRKLKNVIEQHKQTLFVDKMKYDELFGELLARLHGLDEAEGKEDAKVSKNPTYNRQTILQMIVPLLICFPQWSHKWLTPTLSAIILYRCTLPIDGTDRRSLNAAQVIEAIVDVAPNPLELVDSVTAALQIGEEAILSQTPTNAMIGPYKPTSIQAPSMKNSDVDILPQSAKSEASLTQMRRYMQSALKQNSSDLPKKLPLLMEFGLSTLIAILNRAHSERPASPSKAGTPQQAFTLNEQQADDLGLLAAHCLKSYDYVIKRAVVPYCQALYLVLGRDDKAFFKYFEDESEVNLLEYYLAGIRV